MNKDIERTAVVWLSVVFSIYSLLLILMAWYASGIAPDLMQRNYRSVQYANQMQGALVKIFLDSLESTAKDPRKIETFDHNLALQRRNLTEDGEAAIVERLTSKWSAFRDTPASPTVRSMKEVSAAVQEVVDVNEKAMERLEQRALNLRYTVIAAAVLGFVLLLVYAWQIAEWRQSRELAATRQGTLRAPSDC